MAPHPAAPETLAAAEPRTVEAFQTSVEGLSTEIDAWLLAHERSLPQASRHAVEDARLSLLRAHRDLSRVKGHQRRRKRGRVH